MPENRRREILLQCALWDHPQRMRESAEQCHLDLSGDHLYKLPVGLPFTVLQADELLRQLHQLPGQLLVRGQPGESVPAEFREPCAVQHAEPVHL